MTHQDAPCIIIPAAGMGLRMKSFGPKCLVGLTESDCILSRLVSQFRQRWPNSLIYVTVGFELQKVQAKCQALGIIPVEVSEYESCNVAWSVSEALRVVPPGPVLVCYGDLVLANTVVPSLDISGDLAGVIWGDCGLSRINEVGLTVTEQKHIGHLAYDLSIRWSQLAFFNRVGRSILERVLRGVGSDRWLMYEAINKVLAQTPLSFDAVNGWVVEVDFSKDIDLARMAVQMEMEGPDAIPC